MVQPGIIIGVDFDGTCTTHAFPEIGEDIGAVPVLRKLVDAGCKLILWTMRSNHTQQPTFDHDQPETNNPIIDCEAGNYLDHAVKWFADNGIELYGIQRNPTQDTWTSSPKAYCHLFIDDAALGCPLKYDRTKSKRPFADWEAIDNLLFPKRKTIHDGTTNTIQS